MRLLKQSQSSLPATVDRLREELDYALQNWWRGDGDLMTNGDWHPRVDMSETDDAIEVKVDLPGIKPDDIDIRISNNLLTISGKREEEKETKEKTLHRVERSCGSFFRSIALPPGTDAEKIEAVADNGVISITVPKGAEALAKKIAVKPK